MNRSKWVARLLIVCMLWMANLPVWAAGGPVVKSIHVFGNQSVSEAAILATLRSKIGAPFNPILVEDDIRALFKRGDFADIRVSRNPTPGGVQLIYRVVERPTISRIEFQGNKRVKTKAIEEKITIKPYKPLVGAELADAVAAIQKLYEDKRYYSVDVDYTLTPDKDGTVLKFVITEHERSAVRRVQFVGNRMFPDGDLRAVVRSKEKGAQVFRKGKFDQAMLDIDVALLTRHYLNHGYLRVRVLPPQVDLSKDKRHIYLTYTIEEGRAYTLRDVRLEGDILTTKQELERALTAKSGALYKQDDTEKDLHALEMRYGELGYAFANIIPDPMPDDATGTADLIYRISKGRRAMVESIEIAGNSITRDKVIRRELLLKEGDLFNRQLLEESRSKLMQLGFFESVDFATPRGSSGNAVDLKITVKEKPTGTFNLGAGFSTGDSFFFTGSVSKQNFFGKGLAGQFSVEVSKRRQQYVAQITDPHFLDSNWSLSVSSQRVTERRPEYSIQSFGGSVGVGHDLFKHGFMNVNYEYSDLKASDFDFSVPTVFQQNASGTTSAVSTTVGIDKRDNRIFPRSGYYLSATNQISGNALGGDNSFYRVTGAARYYLPIWKSKDLNSRFFLKGGYIESLNGSTVPLFNRFIMGGPNSLRGFNLWSVGPSVRIPSSPSGGDINFVYGGTKMVQGNIEVELPIYAPGGFKAVAFLDAGNSYAEDENISLAKLRANYGVGIRWQSPLGALRFEWGFPITRRNGEPATVFNFTIGDFM